ncbi:hypothetical protein FVE85_8347 [Porphyridium purpureum]|uniref:Uncharacterized protein n=1 Tax=Porphyridium purpureum TaxID=35688 RepID=A0A5J4YL43_PORPP|nr:hypothetical protein FVE85_8347 [Porphyridium purpureum]|eukprot:POR8226..scf244_11
MRNRGGESAGSGTNGMSSRAGAVALAREYAPCIEYFRKISKSRRKQMAKRAATGESDLSLRAVRTCTANLFLVLDAHGATLSLLVEGEMLSNETEFEAA